MHSLVELPSGGWWKLKVHTGDGLTIDCAIISARRELIRSFKIDSNHRVGVHILHAVSKIEWRVAFRSGRLHEVS